MMISAGQVLNLYKRLGGMGRTIKPTLHPGDVLIFNKCLVHRFKLVNVNMKISSINQCGGEYYRLYFTASPPQTPKEFKVILIQFKFSYFELQLLWREYFGEEEVGLAGLTIFTPDSG